MKKVLIIVAAAIAATFSMTSCVETNESASVTALREAKAEQYRALADMYRAQGAADSIKAAAKAAYLQALADYQKEQTDEAAQEFALKLEYLKLKYQYDMMELEKMMNEMQKQIAESATQYITYLYTNYKNKVEDLNDLNEQLFLAQMNLAKANADLLDAQAYVAEQTAIQNEIIAAAQAKIEIYNSYSGVDRAAIEDEYERIVAQIETASSDQYAKRELRDQAETAATDMIDENYTLDWSTANPPYVDMNRRENTAASLVQIYKFLSELQDDYDVTPTNSTVTIDDSTGRLTYAIETYNKISYYSYWFDESDTVTAYESIESEIERLEREIGAPSNPNANPAVQASGAYLALENAEEALETYLSNTPAANQDQATIENLQEAIDLEKENLADLQNQLAEQEALSTRLPILLDSIRIASVTYLAEINALDENTLVTAFFDACVEYENACRTYTDLNAQESALYDMLYTYGGYWVYVRDDYGNITYESVWNPHTGSYDYIPVIEFIPYETSVIDVQEKIKEQEQIIATAEAAIERLSYINNIDTDDPTQNEELAQYMIDSLTAQIAQLEQEIAAMQIIVDDAKAALDAALASSGTPAE